MFTCQMNPHKMPAAAKDVGLFYGFDFKAFFF
jgi:hypothetical protein